MMTPIQYPREQLQAIQPGLERIDRYLGNLVLEANGTKTMGRKAFLPLHQTLKGYPDTALSYLFPYLKEPVVDPTDLLARRILVQGLLLWCKQQCMDS